MNNLSATELNINPYAPGQIGSVATPAHAEQAVLDPRAPGLDGDILDQLLKGRWQEGHETGYNDGHAAARQRYAPIFDEGYGVGRATGEQSTRAQMAQLLVPAFQRQLETFAAIKETTGSAAIKDHCTIGVEAAQSVIEALAQIGLNVDNSAGEVHGTRIA